MILFLVCLQATPPSPERVAANKETLEKLGAGGEWGKEIYAKKVAHLKATQSAYKAYDEGLVALKKGDVTTATKLAQKAIAGEPREARFQELLGDIALTEKKPQDALKYYDKAIKMQPDYFKPHIQSGIALYNMGKKAEAEPYLKRANELLPTAPGYALLGQIAEGRGEIDVALQDYQMAAGSNSDIGKEAAVRMVTIDLPRNPSKYIQSGPVADDNGNVFAVVQNATSVPIGRVQVRVIKYDPNSGRPVAQSKPMLISGGVAPGRRNQISIGERVNTQQELRLYKVVVLAAEVAK